MKSLILWNHRKGRILLIRPLDVSNHGKGRILLIRPLDVSNHGKWRILLVRPLDISNHGKVRILKGSLVRMMIWPSAHNNIKGRAPIQNKCKESMRGTLDCSFLSVEYPYSNMIIHSPHTNIYYAF